MKNYLIPYAPYIVGVALMAGMVVPALAEESTVTRTPKPSVSVRPIPSVRAEVRQEVQERRQEIKDRLSDAGKRRMKAWWTNASRRLNAVVDRLGKLAEKIRARLDALAKKGRDVAQLRADLVNAQAKIDVAKQKLTSGSTEIDAIITANTPKDAFAKIRELHKGILVALRDAHQALIKVLAATRGLSETTRPSVSVSPSPTTTP